MNIEEIKKKIESDEYDFLRTNKHLGDNICLLGLGGSHAYGLENENSDLDIRGVAANKPEEIIGCENFENFRNDETDTVIYGVNSFIKLLAECNPNIIEILGLRKDQFLKITPIGQKILDNKDIFLSQRVYYTFGGYALAQLRKLDNALSSNSEKQEVKEEHILNSIKRYQRTWNEQFPGVDSESFKLYIDKSDKPDMESEIYTDIKVKKAPLREIHAALRGMTDIVRDYDKLSHRNNKKSEMKLGKHMSHLVRLYKMGAEILRTGEVNTYREKDRQELLEIKNGKFINEDGTVKPEFRTYVDELEKDLEKALSESKLPKKPDFHKIQELVMDINMTVLEQAEMSKNKDDRR